MPVDTNVQPDFAARLISILTVLLNADWVNLVAKLSNLIRQIVTARAHEGMYENLEYDVTLELLDPKGHRAVLHKRQKVRYLQDNIIAFQDKAWGDGNAFAAYKCSPGKMVDRYRVGQAYRILISLQGVRHRGDIEEINIDRTIENGYLIGLGFYQTDIDDPTKKLSLRFVFPRSRPPKSIQLMERQTRRITNLGPDSTLTLPDGRCQVTWHMDKPRLFESYTVQWIW